MLPHIVPSKLERVTGLNLRNPWIKIRTGIHFSGHKFILKDRHEEDKKPTADTNTHSREFLKFGHFLNLFSEQFPNFDIQGLYDAGFRR